MRVGGESHTDDSAAGAVVSTVGSEEIVELLGLVKLVRRFRVPGHCGLCAIFRRKVNVVLKFSLGTCQELFFLWVR